MQKTKTSEMEKAVRALLTDGKAVWIPDKEVDMKTFAEYPREKEGIAVYYPIYRDGSCASPVYVKFFSSPSGMSIELADEREYREQEKERIGYLLRRENTM